MEDEVRFIRHTSCDQDDCGSSDANAVYSDGHTHCFSCGVTVQPKGDVEMMFDDEAVAVDSLPHRGFKERGITKKTAQFFDVRVSYDESGQIAEHYYPYTKEGQVALHKIRTVATKDFRIAGGKLRGTELFGQSRFSPGGKTLIITEGELDCLAVAQSQLDCSGKYWPTVSVPSATGTRAILDNLDYVRSFDSVHILFDSDEAGRRAAEEAAKIIGFQRAKIGTLIEKDPCDVLIKHGSKALYGAQFDVVPYSPAGLVWSDDTWESYKAEQDAVYTPYAPFLSKMNKKLYGRRMGSLTMITSGTGCGKTQFCREDIYHVLTSTVDNIGICSLEESVAETTRGLMSVHLNRRLGLPDVEVSQEDEYAAWEATMGGGRLLLLDHQGSVSDTSLVDKIEFMALSGCKYIYLDHVTIAVSEDTSDTNKAIDKLMSDLLKLCKRHDVWIGVVSHLRKTMSNQDSFEEGGNISMDDLKGSGSLKQISAQVIALSRNQKAENELERSTVQVSVLKDRFTGNTGHAGQYRFDMQSGRLLEVKNDPLSGFEEV